MTAAILAVIIGGLLLITTPNYPGAPDAFALHPAVHIVGGAVGVLWGLAIIGRRIEP